ncbi:TonB-dependent receptor domain-containing protein [Stenotrophobium rhamnosiphilum]|nr:TonB-dependent receptor [Stenotrophobium rhamnosiphilum]
MGQIAKKVSALKAILISLMFFMVCGSMPALAAEPLIRFDIPAQELSSSLNQFSVLSNRTLIYSPELVGGLTAPAVQGEFTPDQVIQKLLNGTGLIYRAIGDEKYAVVKEGDITGSPFVEGQSNMAQIAQGGPNSGLDAPTDASANATSTTDKNSEVLTVKKGGIEEVIVTARKRAESSQSVPISITAISADDIKAMGVRTMGDLEGIVPGLNMGGGGNGIKKDNNPFIRGIGQRETKVTLDPGVGTYVDGIYIGRPSGGLFDVADVENVEVLRGPQGTLFGRNATGGAISITLKKPGNSFAGHVNTNIGNYGRRDASVAFDIPIVDNLVLSRLTLSSMQNDGYFTNVVDHSNWGNDNRMSGIAQVRILPTSDLSIDILGERTRIRERPRPQKCKFLREPGYIRSFTGLLMDLANASVGVPTFESVCRASGDLPQNKFSSDLAEGIDYRNNAPGSASDIQPQARYWVDTSTLGGTVKWNIGDVGPISGLALKSISAWRKTGQIADEDLDAVGGTYLLRVQPSMTFTNQLSQEFQLTGATFNDRLFFSTGVYLFGEKTPRDELILSAGLSQGTGDFGGRPPEEFYTLALEPAKERLQTDNKAWAWYGQFDFDITKQWQLSAGVRYTNENRWSRYSKNNVDQKTMVNGVITGSGGSQGAGTVFAYSTLPGLKPVLDWQFGSCMSPSEPGKLCVVTPFGDENTNPANFVIGAMPGDEKRRKDDAWTPMLSLKYKASSEVLKALHLNEAMTYFTYSQGFHSGGVTAGAPDDNGNGVGDPIEFKPEYVKNYEIGLKTQAWDNRVQANFAAFYMDYTDMQLSSTGISVVGIPVPYVSNVGKSVIQGVEAEFIVMPLPDWRVMFNGGYTHADIKEWNEKQVKLDFMRRSGEVTYIDRSDEPMPRVPRFQAFFMTDYTFRLPSRATITPGVSVRYTTELYNGFDRGSYCYTYGGVCDRGNNRGFFDPPNDAVIVPEPSAKHALTSDKAAFVDTRVAWMSSDARMEVALWCKNLLNKDDYMVSAIPLTDVNGATGLIYANPRTYGMNMTYHFGAE